MYFVLSKKSIYISPLQCIIYPTKVRKTIASFKNNLTATLQNYLHELLLNINRNWITARYYQFCCPVAILLEPVYP